ncbi:unnamed protein product, partial [Ectocarpus sp. 12 AP-2014]
CKPLNLATSLSILSFATWVVAYNHEGHDQKLRELCLVLGLFDGGLGGYGPQPRSTPRGCPHLPQDDSGRRYAAFFVDAEHETDVSRFALRGFRHSSHFFRGRARDGARWSYC